MKAAAWIMGALGLGGLAYVATREPAKEPAKDPTKDPPTKEPTKGDVPVEPWTPTPYEKYSRGPYTIDLTGLANGVRWRVFLTKRLQDEGPETEAAKDALKIYASVELTEYEARAGANAFVDSLMISNPMPPKPQPDGDAAPAPDSILRYGLRMSDCRSVVVEDLPVWVAWSAPKLRAAAVSMDPADAVGEVFGLAFPDCQLDIATLEIHGVPVVARIQRVSETLEAIREGKAFAQTHPLDPAAVEVAAARLVGRELGQHAPPAFPHRGWIVRLAPEVGGGGWGWTIERPGQAPSSEIGASTMAGAIQAAKAKIVELG